MPSFSAAAAAKDLMLTVLSYTKDDSKMSVSDPGTSYTSMSIKWNYIPYRPKARGKLILTEFRGNETGAGKGIRLRNVTDAVTLAEKTWDGDTMQPNWESPEFTFPDDGKQLALQCKGSSGTEDIAVSDVHVLSY